jgi:cytoskeletal protein CcmA (bactofilin family)
VTGGDHVWKDEQTAEPHRQLDRIDDQHRRESLLQWRHTLVVSENARIDGEVHAAHIVVNGTIVGPVHATETLELQAGSRIKGDVYYKSIEMVQGSVVEGRMVHQGEEVKSVELKLATGS